MNSSPLRPTRLRLTLTVAVTALAGLAALPAGSQAATTDVKVMTRNVYLGADLTPGVRATGLQELVNAAGGILKSVDQNKFKTRAKGLAAEISKEKPHLVGLQEAALWRTAPCTQSPVPPKATTVRYDYIKLLLAAVNKGKTKYKAVVVQPEFDFEIFVNFDGNQSTSAPGCPFGSEFNGRLTMRDAILVRRGVKTSGARRATFDTQLQVRPAGAPTNVTRGWTSLDAKVGSSRKFRFVNTHLEAFDNQPSNNTNKGTTLGNGQVREAQARELIARGRSRRGRQAARDPARRPELRHEDRGEAGRRARPQGADDRRLRRPQREEAAQLLPQRRPAHGWRRWQAERLRPHRRPRAHRHAEAGLAQAVDRCRSRAGERVLAGRPRGHRQHAARALSP